MKNIPLPGNGNQFFYPNARKPLGNNSFDGVFQLDNAASGNFYADTVQSGVMNFSEGTDAVLGGCDYVKITADGNAINVPGSWKKFTTQGIDITVGKINRIMVMKTDSEILYSVAVE